MFTKLFDGYSERKSEGGYPIYVGVDKQINKFLEENPDCLISDIKMAVRNDGDAEILYALVIFK